MTQEGEKGVGLGLPPLHDLGIKPATPFPQAPQGFFCLLLALGPIDLLQNLSQCFSVLFPYSIERIPYRAVLEILENLLPIPGIFPFQCTRPFLSST